MSIVQTTMMRWVHHHAPEFERRQVRIRNSMQMEIEPTIAAVSAFLIGVTGVVLLLDSLIRGRSASTLRAQR